MQEGLKRSDGVYNLGGKLQEFVKILWAVRGHVSRNVSRVQGGCISIQYVYLYSMYVYTASSAYANSMPSASKVIHKTIQPLIYSLKSDQYFIHRS